MKNSHDQNKVRYRIFVCVTAVALLVLLHLLTLVESTNAKATIRTPLDALWYFMSTITTVGYGDMSPVTPLGKAFGMVFILLSCGFISVVVTTSIRFMNSSYILRLRVALARADMWYIFDAYSPESQCLARKLWDLPENSGIIFCNTERQIRGLLNVRCIYTPLDPQETLHICTKNLKNRTDNVPRIFLVGDNEEANLKTSLSIAAAGIASKPYQIYCRTCVRFQVPPKGLHTFDSAELTARAYWAEHPLSSNEKNVVIIGSHALLNYIIEQAILVNVFGPLLRCCYHIFSENELESRNSHKDESFLDDHPRIKEVVSVMTVDGQNPTPDPENDTFCFHAENWDTNHACMEMADRIIICSPSEIDNIRMAEKIRLLCATKADIFIYGSDSIDGVNGFGSLNELYTPERILREEQLRRAQTLNEYYNSLQKEACKKHCWDELSMFTRHSNMAAADHMGTKLRILTGNLDKKTAVSIDPDTTALAIKNFRENVIDRELCRRIEHERWMRFHSMYGWTYGEMRDNTLRRHPLMVPFDDLTPDEQAMDDISWELIGTLQS